MLAASDLAAGPLLAAGPAGLEPGSSEPAAPVSRDPGPVEGSGVSDELDAQTRAAGTSLPGARGGGRRGSCLSERGDDVELGRLVESTVWINTAHPAYRRAVASRSEGYHVELAAALALAPLAVEPAAEHAFVTAFLGSWGAALDRRGPRSRRRPQA